MNNGPIRGATRARLAPVCPLHSCVHHTMITRVSAPPPPPPYRSCWQDTCVISSWSGCRSGTPRGSRIQSKYLACVAFLRDSASSYWSYVKRNNIKCSPRELWHSAATKSHLQELGHFSPLRSWDNFSLSQWHGYYLGHLISSNKIDLFFQAVLECLCQ